MEFKAQMLFLEIASHMVQKHLTLPKSQGGKDSWGGITQLKAVKSSLYHFFGETSHYS